MEERLENRRIGWELIILCIIIPLLFFNGVEQLWSQPDKAVWEWEWDTEPGMNKHLVDP